MHGNERQLPLSTCKLFGESDESSGSVLYIVVCVCVCVSRLVSFFLYVRMSHTTAHRGTWRHRGKKMLDDEVIEAPLLAIQV